MSMRTPLSPLCLLIVALATGCGPHGDVIIPDGGATDGGPAEGCLSAARVCFDDSDRGPLVATFNDAQARCVRAGLRLPNHAEWLTLWVYEGGPSVSDASFSSPMTDDNPDGLVWTTDVWTSSGTDMGPADSGSGTWSWRFGLARTGDRMAAVRCVR